MADTAIAPTPESDNFIRFSRVLIKAGTKIVNGLFNSIHDPSVLRRTLQNRKTVLENLKTRKIINQTEWEILFPSDTTYGESTNFDLTLLLKLLRNICNLTAPATGWNALPIDTDLSLEADLARIKYRRNTTFAHTPDMELTEHEFNDFWPQIQEALLRIVNHYSPGSVDEWRKEIEKRRTAPISSEDRTELLNELDIIHGQPIVDQGSKFQAHLKEVTSKDQINEVLRHIKQDLKYAEATNIVWVYRYYDEDKETYIDDSHDGGEYLAGKRLQYLLRHVDAANVVVIVTCWQGDVYLHMDVFMHINERALELLLSCDLVGEQISKHDIPKLLEKLEHKIERKKQKMALERYESMKQAVAERQEPADFDIIHSEVITYHRSTFQAHIAHVTSKDQVEQVLAILKKDSKIAKATYNMYAYRIYVKDKKSYLEEGRDDGENRASKRLLHLLEVSKVEDVVVIVTRWHGGVHIGSERFRHINACASEVIKMGLDQGVLSTTSEQVQTKQKKGKGKGKHK